MPRLSIQKNYAELSFLVALGYIVLCSCYILLSGHVAASLSHSVDQLAHIERIKGIAFMVVTGSLVFTFMFFFFRRIAHQLLEIMAQTELIKKQKELISESEQRALAGTFAASTAHDINNVLGIVTFSVDEINSLPNLPDESKTYLMQVEKAFGMIGDLSTRLMAIGKQKVLNDISMVDVSDVVRKAVELGSLHTRIRSCSVSSHMPATPFFMRTNPRVVEQCVLNLMLNAADAINSEGRIDVMLREENGSAILEVHDDGPGIPEDDRVKVFEAFYTTKVKGAGLGLAGVKVSVELLSGSVDVSESPLGGAMFRIILPATQE